MALTRPREGLVDATRKRYPHFHRKRFYAEQFRDRDLDLIAKQLAECQETELLASCTHCGKSWWVVNKCRLRVCPLCSYAIAKERGAYLIAMTKHMEHPKLLTLTTRQWTGDPHQGIKHLKAQFARLRRSKLFRAVKGGAYQVELKKKENGFHIHIHCLFDGPYMPYQKIFSEWRRILGETCPQIDIRAATSQRAREYAAKYAAKAGGYDTAAFAVVDWYLATKGERLFATFGKWYNAKLEELDPDAIAQAPQPNCPHCGSLHTTYLARDGPYIYGHDIWRSIAPVVMPGGIYLRAIPEVRKTLDDPPPKKQNSKPTEEQCTLSY